MDTNLDDSINLESSIGVDFDQSEDNTVINQPDITLHESQRDNISMEFEHIEEQPMLMDADNEEIIDFMGEQISMQDYAVQDDQMTGSISFEPQGDQLVSQQETKQTHQYGFPVAASGVLFEDIPAQKPQVVQIQSAAPQRTIVTKKETLLLPKGATPKQVAIAPKPLLSTGPTWEPFLKKGATPIKQYAIAPKPLKAVSVAPKTVSLVKKVSIAGNAATTKSNSMIAQLGKQIVMVPASGAQKLKLVAAGGGTVSAVRLLNAPDSGQTQLISTDGSSGQGTKPILAKVVLQGQSTNSDSSNQPAVITKLVSGGVTPQTLKYVTMQQKTVPISIANNKVMLASPTKGGVRFGKKHQLFTIQSPTGPKIVPAAPLNQAGVTGATTKKVVITANPSQNIVVKNASASKPGHITKVVSGGPRTQLHRINVPGKGVQFIRLVTNPSQATKVAPKSTVTTTAPKTFVLTDNKGNMIQMSTDQLVTGQPPPLVSTVTSASLNKSVATKPPQKLVRIAPLTSKPGQAAMHGRSGQSLLAPITPQAGAMQEHVEAKVTEEPPLNAHSADMPSLGMDDEGDYDDDDHDEHIVAEEIDSKAALQELIAKTLDDEIQPHHNMNEVEIEYDKQQQRQDESGASNTDDHSLIVIPYCKQEMILPENIKHEPQQVSNVLNVQVDYNQCQPDMSPLHYAASDTEMASSDLGLRPRKACNCTKSQCLKLYCDCFASGEFCNGCNCNNCHNNLENEELRQKAIRGCLDRNPNAFRPKIGKAKLGGPEIIRRHNKGCNCKRSGCLKNYCECYEAKIACTAICKCVGCRNVEDSLERGRHPPRPTPLPRADTTLPLAKQPCSFMTTEVIEAVCQCLVAAAGECAERGQAVREVLEEFARCLHDIISAAQHAPSGPRAQPRRMLSEMEA